ncbi:unnamed protein product [Brassicogethes aeneus]|uniref:Conserved oligomeric Golgi complex subunit 2 n=1 Tax=Brassicogethes aeneus TaxID=1431903 RepID=A0A9P0BEI7_BRAAE|nr:unnamed protein product [Brassicogethes aeneus]
MDLQEDVMWKESFFKDNFSVDNCLSQYTVKSDLETLRRELKCYGNHLQQQMSEILKLETEAIVNLAEYLTNLSSKIEDLSVPIHQLREEIKNLYELIKLAEDTYSNSLECLKSNNTKQHNISLILGIISSAFYIENMINSSQKESFDDLTLLERIVNKYSFQRNYLDELEIIAPETENILRRVESQLLSMINKKFLESVKQNDVETITKCLRMFDNLGKQIEAQKTFQANIVKPALEPLFTESHLVQCDHDISKIYEEALFFMDNTMGVIFDILKRNPDMDSYNFALNSFWTEFDKQSREGLPYITAPGNPELFQKRFNLTWNLLAKIAAKCGDKSLIKQNESFQEHIKRFNLPVYFEIRFQQIAGKFETDLLNNLNEDIYAPKNDLNVTLKLTQCFMAVLTKCFQPDVFIEHLADQFLKLSMLLLTRYLLWFKTRLKDKLFENKAKLEDFVLKSLIDLSVIKNVIAPNTEDINTINHTVYSIMPNEIKPVILKVFKSNRKHIGNNFNDLASYLVKLKLDESLVQLHHVGAIPRLYRRTNRSAPKEASSYMLQAVTPIVSFKGKFEKIIEHELGEIMDNIIYEVTNQYLILVQEVLMSVCKTEESLRRLKSRNINASDDSGSTDSTSDEMKIRQQIRLDVGYFIDKLYTLGGERAKASMEKLRQETNK